MKGWYKAKAKCALPHDQVTLGGITEDKFYLYHQILPLGENIHISVENFLVDESVPMTDYIEWAVQKMRSNLS